MALLVVVILQAMFAAHALQRGHGWHWVFLVLFCPILGLILYAYYVVVPEMQYFQPDEQASSATQPFRDIDSEIEHYQRQVDLADTVSNRAKLADVLIKHGRPDEAIPLYEQSLQGPYKDDLQLSYGLAQAAFEAHDFSRTRDVLSHLIEAHPHARLPEQQLLYARALDALDEFSAACQAYQDLATIYSGPEVKFHYAMMLKARGEGEAARDLLQEIDATAKQSSNYYNTCHQECIVMARQELD